MSLRSALEIATLTDTGVVRSFNEDAVATEFDLGLVLVADGMGGYKAGDVASGLASSVIMSEIKHQMNASTPDSGAIGAILVNAIKLTNQKIFRAAQSNLQYQGMGTTVVVAMFHDNQIFFAHVGDSRLYRLRRGKLTVLTQDHSILHDQVAAGLISADDAKTSHNRNLVTQALGIEADLECRAESKTVELGDIYILCSDGLNDMVDDADIELAADALNANMQLMVSQMIMMANDNGGHDNISVSAIKVLKPFPAGEDAPKGFLSRMFGWLK
ncbi:MAG: protein phosphatase 2C domain-containing protein [Sulfuricellaceae bacterium]|nr:protein phosphatase 2C domain-containing protein [Sulfuricellaceae bacterium]